MLLVCEGQCNNGRVKQFDLAVALAGTVACGRTKGDQELITSDVSEVWLSEARRFKHTPHDHSTRRDFRNNTLVVDRDVAVCVVCGSMRRWLRGVEDGTV